MSEWTEADFDRLSWHDNHVHGLQIQAGPYGAGELLLDLDYILEWIACGQGRVEFRIAPATLAFRDVTGLELSLDYATPSAALGPFSIDSITREQVPRERYTAQLWTIAVNWPAGRIRFEAAGFRQRLTGATVRCDQQVLERAARVPLDTRPG